jgi:hypothetical protein
LIGWFAWGAITSAAPLVGAAQDQPGLMEGPIDVQWSAPRDCPDREAVLRTLQERMPAREVAVPLRARAKVLRHGSGYRLHLELDSPSGRAARTLANAKCEPLAEAAAVLIMLAIETEAASAARAPEPVEAPPPAEDARALTPGASPAPAQGASATNTEPPARSASVKDQETIVAEESDSLDITHDNAPDASSSELHLQLSAALRADLGTFPHQPALGVQAQLAARISSLSVGLGLTYWPAREQPSLSYPNARLFGRGLFADLAAGVDISARPIMLTPALNVELGQLDAQAVGIEGPERSRMLWIALGPSLSAAVSLFTDWSIALEVSGLVPAYRTHWLVRTPAGDVPAFDAAPIVLRGALRIGYALR